MNNCSFYDRNLKTLQLILAQNECVKLMRKWPSPDIVNTCGQLETLLQNHWRQCASQPPSNN